MTPATFYRQVERLYSLGPRVVGELLLEIDGGADLDAALDRYSRLDRRLLAAIGGDRFPALPKPRRVA